MERTITISEETWGKIKSQVESDGYKSIDSLKDMVGKSYFFRTVTYHMTGRVKKVMQTQSGDILELEKAAWIADSGRFMQAIKEGKLNEVEPVGVAYINMASVTEFFPWVHALPETQK